MHIEKQAGIEVMVFLVCANYVGLQHFGPIEADQSVTVQCQHKNYCNSPGRLR